MRRWQSHEIVEAEPIVARPGTNECWVSTSMGDITVPKDFFARGVPATEDYLVRYEDGYLSWSPKKAFEEGYTLIDEERDLAWSLNKNMAMIQEPASRPAPTKWEYRLVSLRLHPNNFNAEGQDGWELVGKGADAVPGYDAVFIFKRPLR